MNKKKLSSLGHQTTSQLGRLIPISTVHFSQVLLRHPSPLKPCLLPRLQKPLHIHLPVIPNPRRQLQRIFDSQVRPIARNGLRVSRVANQQDALLPCSSRQDRSIDGKRAHEPVQPAVIARFADREEAGERRRQGSQSFDFVLETRCFRSSIGDVAVEKKFIAGACGPREGIADARLARVRVVGVGGDGEMDVALGVRDAGGALEGLEKAGRDVEAL